MRQTQMIFLLLLALVSGAEAQSYSTIGIYLDESHTECDILLPSLYISFDMLIYINKTDYNGTDNTGIIGAEFKVTPFPAWLLCLESEINPLFYVVDGDYPQGIEGVSIEASECQYGWILLYRFRVMNVASNIPVILELVARSDSSPLATRLCLEGHPPGVLYPFFFGLNRGGGCPAAVGVEEKSWGLIKSMYK